MDKYLSTRIEHIEQILAYLISSQQITVPEDLQKKFLECIGKTECQLRSQEEFIFQEHLPSDKAINHKARLMYISGHISVMTKLQVFETDEDLNLVEKFFKVLKEKRTRKLSESTFLKYLDNFLIPAYNGRVNIDHNDIPITKEEWRQGMLKIIDVIEDKGIENINYLKKVMSNGKASVKQSNEFKESGMFGEEAFQFGDDK